MNSELRKDIVSGEWVLIAKGRANRPHALDAKHVRPSQPKTSCPFEDPSKANGEQPLFWLPSPDATDKANVDNWFVQVIPNKYPALAPHEKRTCPVKAEYGPYSLMDGIGYHEVVVTRSHEKSLGQMSIQEVELVLRAYQERYNTLKLDPCIAYILIFHNHGPQAGASITHPHSQLIAMPIVPPDVQRSFMGSEQFYAQNKVCIHCMMLKWEREEKKRIVYENGEFIVLAPYASKVSYELRVYPKGHDCCFELVSPERLSLLADAFTAALSRLYHALGDPDYNFFIHTTPVNSSETEHYHWHLEIMPKTSTLAGLELGTGVDVVIASPEDVSEILQNS